MRSITFVLLAVAVAVALLPAPPTDASHKQHTIVNAAKPTVFQQLRAGASRAIGHGDKGSVVVGKALKLGKTITGALTWYKQEQAACNVHNHPKELKLTDGSTIACKDINDGHAIVTVDLGKMNVLEKRIAADTQSLNNMKAAYGLSAANVATKRGSRGGAGGQTGTTTGQGQVPSGDDDDGDDQGSDDQGGDDQSGDDQGGDDQGGDDQGGDDQSGDDQ